MIIFKNKEKSLVDSGEQFLAEGDNYFERKRWFMASEAYKHYLESTSSEDSTLYYRYAFAESKMNRFTSAANLFEKFISLADETATSDEYFDAGFAFDKSGQEQLAKDTYVKAISKSENPKIKEIWDLFISKEEWLIAAKLIEEHVADGNLMSANLLKKLVDCYFYAFDYEKSNSVINQYSSLLSPGAACSLKIRNYENNNQFDQAVKLWEKLPDNVLSRPFFNYRRGYAYYQIKEYEKAATYFELYNLELSFDDQYDFNGILYKSAKAAYDEKDYQNAIKFFNKCILASDDFEPKLFGYIGSCYKELNQFEQACINYLEMKIDKTNAGLSKRPLKNSETLKISVEYADIYEFTTIDENITLYCSYNGASFSGNPYALFKENYKADGKSHIIVVKEDVEVDPKISSLDDVYVIHYDTYAHFRMLSKAKYIMIDSTLPFYFVPKKEQIILNTWHGTPIKTLGYEVKKLGYYSARNTRCTLEKSTHLINPNQFTEEIMSKTYTLEKNSNTQWEITGYPRQDLMINASDELKASLKQKLNIPDGKKVVLYAPTYRGTNNSSDDMTPNKMKNVIKKMNKSKKYHFLYKGHYFEKDTNKQLLEIDSNELLSIVDILITDYSSIAIDYLPMNKPIIYYPFDLIEYREERGFSLDIEELSTDIVFKPRDLIKLVNKQILNPQICEMQIQARKRFCPVDDGYATKRVLEFINKPQPQPKSDKKNILIFAGNILLTNGITRSFENLTASIDKDKYNITILLGENLVIEDEEYPILDDLYKQGYNISIIYGPTVRTLRENYAKNKYYQFDKFLNEKHKQLYMTMLERNIHRQFGFKKYDAVINFESGYTPAIHALLSQVDAKTRILVLHNDMQGEATIRFPILHRTFELYNEYDHIWTVSNAVSKENIDAIGIPYNIPLEKFEVLNNVVDYKSIKKLAKEPLEVTEDNHLFEGDSKVFITLGRLSPEKNHELAINSLKKVIDQTGDTNIKFLILGMGPLEIKTQKLIDELGLADNVKLLGVRKNPFNYLYKSDMFLFPSLHEGQGLVLFEALLTDTPLIATNIPSSVEIIDEYGGVYTDTSVEEFSQAIINYLNGEMDLENTYDPELYNNNILKILYDAIDGR